MYTETRSTSFRRWYFWIHFLMPKLIQIRNACSQWVQLTISEHWVRLRFGSERVPSYYQKHNCPDCHTKATKSHILPRGLPAACHHCGQTLSIDHMLLECAVLQLIHWIPSETIPESCIVEFLREAGFFYRIWMVRHSVQFITWITPDLMEFVNFN